MQLTPSLVIADDHPLVLKGLEDFLVEQNQHILATAKNGKEALALIKAHEPDIAVLDVRMPFLTGIEVAHAIKKLVKNKNYFNYFRKKCRRLSASYLSRRLRLYIKRIRFRGD